MLHKKLQQIENEKERKKKKKKISPVVYTTIRQRQILNQPFIMVGDRQGIAIPIDSKTKSIQKGRTRRFSPLYFTNPGGEERMVTYRIPQRIFQHIQFRT